MKIGLTTDAKRSFCATDFGWTTGSKSVIVAGLKLSAATKKWEQSGWIGYLSTKFTVYC